ncbi:MULTISPECIES: DUF2264 domain-containing protein [Paenibacillus]|uniref:DUF2264 domain-containing protein n=1 Tax=Paenibacillus TaxID=44249 RepID=UPI002FDF3B4F
MSQQKHAQALLRNPLRTKRDLQAALKELTAPLRPHYSEGKARLRLGAAGAGFDAAIAEIEGFSRVLWGMVPLLAGGGEDDLWEVVLEGIRHGTDPAHPEYWGEVADYDQRLVEMAAFGFALALIPDRIWGPLNERERKHLQEWLGQINRHPCYDCNWLFFNVLVNLGLHKAGLPYDQDQLKANLDRIDSFYLADGWYSDGPGAHCDYYVPFAIHFYGLLYAVLMKGEDPKRAALIRERAGRFAADFLYWFAPDGASLPYGRSLTYRFSHSAFWGAMVYAEMEDLPYGVLKGLILRHFRWWFRQPMLDAEGLLTVGYAYPNLVMAENYNSPGSPYWALKAFLPLALPDDHPFWQAEEMPLPAGPPVSVQKPPHLVICRREESGHVAAFNSGNLTTNEHTHTSAKYEKFVYSTAFGFSVPRAEWGLSQGAFDSMLALSEGDNLYRVRRRNEETRIDGHLLYARWVPWRDVEIQTWIVAGLPWHIRIHRVDTARELDAAEGGYALGLSPQTERFERAAGSAVRSVHGGVGIQSLFGYDRAELVYPNANTNILHPRTVIPTVRARLSAGVHWLAAAVYGEPGPGADFGRKNADWGLNEALVRLGVKLQETAIQVTGLDGQITVIEMGK